MQTEVIPQVRQCHSISHSIAEPRHRAIPVGSVLRLLLDARETGSKRLMPESLVSLSQLLQGLRKQEQRVSRNENAREHFALVRLQVASLGQRLHKMKDVIRMIISRLAGLFLLDGEVALHRQVRDRRGDAAQSDGIFQ